MPEIFRDPVWQFFAVVLALAAIAISIVFYLLQRRRKSLSYQLISATSLLSVAREVEGRVQILFEGAPVRQVHLVVASARNSGNIPIMHSEFIRPIKFQFSEKAKILWAEVSETSPESIEANLAVEDHAVVLNLTLLNPGDNVTVKSLVSEFDGTFSVDGRIVGVSRIEKRTQRDGVSRRSRVIATVIVAALTLSLAGSLLASITAAQPLPSLPVLSLLLLIALGGLAILWYNVSSLLDRL